MTKNTISKNAIVTTELSKEDKKALQEVKAQAIATAMLTLEKAIGKDIALATGQAGKLLAGLDSQLERLAKEVKLTDDNAPVLALDLFPVQFTVGDKSYKWVEVNGLDRNAKVQIIDNNGKCEILVTPISSKSMEETAYFKALVDAGKDLTKAVALRKAVSGRKFNQLFAIAKAQDKARMIKKYSKFVPPMASVSEQSTEVVA